LLASTASGPSSFTGEFYLLPFSFEAEAGGDRDVEMAVKAVGVLLSTLSHLGHGFVCFKALVRVLHVLAKDLVHHFLGVHVRGFFSSKLTPGSSVFEGLVGFKQEGDELLVGTSLGAHADLVVDFLEPSVAGGNRAVKAVSVLRADLADMTGSRNREVRTEVSGAFRNACVAEGRALELQVVVDESSAQDHEAQGDEAQ